MHYYRCKNISTQDEEICCTREQESPYSLGDKIVADTRYGKDILEIIGENPCSKCDKNSEKFIDRLATAEDMEKVERNREKAKEAFPLCLEKISDLGLDMQLADVHFLPYEPKVIFFFTAEHRVDFRNLIKELVSLFKMRIELRQINVRNETRMLGGMGICGQTFCCRRMHMKADPVSIKMAKEQNMALNSDKISGGCGRLLCCLEYEYPCYQKERSRMPSEGTILKTEKGSLKVTELNILNRQVTLADKSGLTVKVPYNNFIHDKKSNRWQLSPKIKSELVSTLNSKPEE